MPAAQHAPGWLATTVTWLGAADHQQRLLDSALIVSQDSAKQRSQAYHTGRDGGLSERVAASRRCHRLYQRGSVSFSRSKWAKCKHRQTSGRLGRGDALGAITGACAAPTTSPGRALTGPVAGGCAARICGDACAAAVVPVALRTGGTGAGSALVPFCGSGTSCAEKGRVTRRPLDADGFGLS